MYRAFEGGLSPVVVSALLSVVLIGGAVAWKMAQPFSTPAISPAPIAAPSDTTGDTADTLAELSAPTTITPLGANVLDQVNTAYASATVDGPLTDNTAQSAAQAVITNTHPAIDYHQFREADIPTTADISKERALKYRADLQVTLKPLLGIPEMEIATYARYTETKDPAYLAKLHSIAATYRAVASSTAEVVAPKNAVTEQTGILNAMGKFGGTLDALADNAQDPFASGVLLVSYNEAESDMINSFDALARYYRTHAASATTTP